ncbi:MAG: hypothetical protein ACFFEY_12685 [Candidatus Thorarchaeota archaeon]
MSHDIDLKKLEKKAYRSIFEDGIWDLFIGMLILSFGLAPFIGLFINISELWDVIIPSVIITTIAFLIFYLGKKYITIPRIGVVEFGPKRKSRQAKLKIFLIVMFFINVVLLILPLTDLINYSQIQPLILSLLLGLGGIVLPFCIVAYFLDFTRLYYYSFSMGFGFFLIEFLNSFMNYPIISIVIFSVIGVSIIIIGLTYFIRFLKKYPLSK